jgi:TrmH family RNA methyltransferase
MQIRDLHTTRGRKKSGLFLMEGPHLLDALLASELLPEEIYYQPELLQRTPEGRELLARLLHPSGPWSRLPRFEVGERVAEALSDAQTSQGVVCVLSTRLFQPARILQRRPQAQRPALLILDDLADPGNLGTILRTGLAADVAEIILTPHCVDIFSPKVVRAAAGAHLSLPIWPNLSWSEIAAHVERHCSPQQEPGEAVQHGEKSEHEPGEAMQRSGAKNTRARSIETGRVFVAEARATHPYDAEDLAHPFALIIGNEAHGPSSEARQLANRAISIPLANGVESLNAAMAAGIVLFEAARQVRQTYP